MYYEQQLSFCYWFVTIGLKNATSPLSLGNINNAAIVSVYTQQMNNTLVLQIFMRDSTCSISAVLYMSHRKICRSSSVQAVFVEILTLMNTLNVPFERCCVEKKKDFWNLTGRRKSSQSIINGKCVYKDLMITIPAAKWHKETEPYMISTNGSCNSTKWTVDKECNILA